MNLMPTFKANDYSRTIVTTMKDEGPYILEWIGYHLSIGFTHFIVLTNDCSDGTEKLLRHLENLGLVTQKNNPAPHPRGPQKNGYLRMRRLEAFQQAEWLLALDCDEFLRIDVGNGHLDDLFAAIGNDIHAISFVWLLFGNDGIKHIEDTLCVSQFTKTAHPLQARPYETLPFKTLFKNGYFKKIGTHRPNAFDTTKTADFKWIDADGCDISRFTIQRHWCAHVSGLGFGTALGRVNHYALRSIDGFMNKWSRGFVHPDAPTVRGKGTAQDYWKLFNWNSHKDVKIQTHASNIQAITKKLKDEPKILKFHDMGLEWHLDRAKTLRAEHPQAFADIENWGPSDINGELPDFSKHGCPPIGNIPYVNEGNLIKKLLTSILAPKLLSKLQYDGIEGSK